MVDQEANNLNKIYLENFDAPAKLCEYHVESGEFEEVDRTEAGNVEPWKGYYISVEGQAAGLYASPAGPVVFFDQQRYWWKDAHVETTRIALNQDRNLFTFRINGELKKRIEYPKSKYVGFDNWSTEDMVDFFLWLHERGDND